MKFHAVHRLGKPLRPHGNKTMDNKNSRSARPRPVIARFALRTDAQCVKSAVYKRPKGALPKIGVQDDITPAWASVRRQAYIAHVKPAKAKG